MKRHINLINLKDLIFHKIVLQINVSKQLYIYCFLFLVNRSIQFNAKTLQNTSFTKMQNDHSNQCHSASHYQSQPQINTYLPSAKQVVISKSIFGQCQVLMIVDNSYIAIHHDKNIYLVDQHAACQKLLYMEYYKRLKNQRESTSIKQKTIYEIPNLYRNLLVHNQKDVNKLGWEYKVAPIKGIFTEIIVFKQPEVFRITLNQEQLLYYLQQMYDNEDKQWQQIKDQIDLSQKEKQIIARHACHKSYRFGQKIQLKKAQQLIRKLSDVQAPFNCPHSRVLVSHYGDVKQLGLV